MKTKILILFVLLFQMSCNKDSETTKQDPVFQLPPETQIGANTFGVTINGKVYIPRDRKGTGYAPTTHALVVWRNPDFTWYEIEAFDGASPLGFQIYIHMQPLVLGKLVLNKSNFHKDVDSIPFTHIYFNVWDSKINKYAYYGSIENEGEINITKLAGGILSGNFKGKFFRYDNPEEIIEITDGRFDINGFTLPNQIFP